MNAVAAAIANGVADALGVRMEQLPLTSERVLQAWLASGAAGMNVPATLPRSLLSPLGAGYAQRVLPLGQRVHGIEVDHGSDPYQTLTVFPADRPSGDVLVFFHGGGWTNGYKEWMYFMAPALNAQGVTFVSAGYRLAPAHVFPAGQEDCADAVAWVLQHIGEHGGNGERVFVGGHSAGGHYAALLAVTAGWRSVRGLPAQALAGCLPVSGVYRFGEGSGLSVRPRFLGTGTPGEAEAAACAAEQDRSRGLPAFPAYARRARFPAPRGAGSRDGRCVARGRCAGAHRDSRRLRPLRGQPGLR